MESFLNSNEDYDIDVKNQIYGKIVLFINVQFIR